MGASSEKWYYQVVILDIHGRQIGHDVLQTTMNLASAVECLMTDLKEARRKDPNIVAGGYVQRLEKRPPQW